MVLIVLVGLSSVADAWLPDTMPAGRTLSRVLTSLPVVLAVAFGVMTLVYRTVPPRAPKWRSILLPAAVVAVIAVVLSQVFVFLAPRLVGAAALAGSLATAFVALAWLSFTFQALLYGAAWVRVREDAASGGPTRGGRRGRARVSRPGTSRTAGRTGRKRRVTGRSSRTAGRHRRACPCRPSVR